MYTCVCVVCGFVCVLVCVLVIVCAYVGVCVVRERVCVCVLTVCVVHDSLDCAELLLALNCGRFERLDCD